MTVDLAKLALWLYTFTVGAPLSMRSIHHDLDALLSSAVELPEWFPGQIYGYSRPKLDWWTQGDSEAE